MKPLEGLRVVDFGIITAGASTSAMLADLGAEVIKIEGPAYIDPFRKWAGVGDEAAWWNASPHFRFTNRNKKSLCVDLKSAQGRAILLDLVAVSDIVVENFRVGVLDRLGLGFGELEKANPRIVLGSVSSQGLTGPEAGAASFGSTLEASSGFADLIRYSDAEAPHISGQALNYPDQVVSLFATGLIVSTVLEARRTQRSYHVDISQREVTAYLLGEKLVAAAYGVDAGASTGAPDTESGVYPCADGQWIAVTVDKHEAAPAWATRLGVEGAAADSLAPWIAARSADDALRELRDAGVDACLARRAADLRSIAAPDADRTAFALAPDGQPVKGLPWKTDGACMAVRSPAPRLGEHNRSVVVDLLNYSDETYNEWVEQGVLAQVPVQPAHLASATAEG